MYDYVNNYDGLNIVAYFKIPNYQYLLSANPVLCDINGVEITTGINLVLKESFETFNPIFYDLSKANFIIDYKNYMFVTPTLDSYENYLNGNSTNDPIWLPVDATNEFQETFEIGTNLTTLQYGNYSNINSSNYNNEYGVLSSGTDNIFITSNISRKTFSPSKFGIFYGQHYKTDYAFNDNIEEVPSLIIVKSTMYIICHAKFPQTFHELNQGLKIPVHVTIKRKNGNSVYSNIDPGVNKPPIYTVFQDNTKIDLDYFSEINPAIVNINAPLWDQYYSYKIGDIVRKPETTYHYRSISNNNSGHNPSNGVYWEGIPEADNQMELSNVFVAEVSFYESEIYVVNQVYNDSPGYDIELNFTNDSYYKDFNSGYFDTSINKIDFINTTGKVILEFGRNLENEIIPNPYLNGLILKSSYEFDINNEPWIEYN